MTLDDLRLLLLLSGSFLLAGFIVLRLIRLRVPAFPPRQSDVSVPRLPDQESKLRQQVNWLVELRWIAAGTILLLMILAVAVFQLLPSVTLFYLSGWWLVLIAANYSFSRWSGSATSPEHQLVVQISTDLVILTGLLNASGGIENPLYLAYVLPVVIAAILLPKPRALAVAVLACLLFGSLAAGEAFHVLPHYTLTIFPHPASAHEHSSSAPEPSLSEPEHASFDPRFVAGKSLPLVFALLFTSYLASLLRERLQESEDTALGTAHEILLEHQRLESMVQAADVGMMVVEPEVKVRWFSRRVEEWLGWSDGVRGGVCPLFQVEGGCRECVALSALARGQAAEVERQVVKGGAGRYFRHVAQPVRDPTGRVIQVVELVDDVTKRKALEAEALHAGKLSVLGHLAAGLAHEIGNPLASLSTRLKRLERERDPGFLDESIALIQQQIKRIGRTVRNVSLYSRNRPEEWSSCQVNAIVEEAMNLVRLDHRFRDVRFEKALLEPSPSIRGVRDQVVQVLVNLLLNAMEAMPKGGVLRTESAVTDRGVELTVSDSGLGIPSDVRDHIFEPFVTTKPQGVGLGLAISRSLVQAHGGDIEVAGLSDGKGTRFTVVLPMAGCGASSSGTGRTD